MKSVEVTSDYCRKLFKSLNLTYEDARQHINVLINYLDIELQNYGKTKNGQDIKMVIDKKIKHDKKGGIYILVDGSYFKNREAISFNNDGFIGFCGWASTSNSVPIYDAFILWCQYVYTSKKEYAKKLTI